jgi:hypothetical protein
MLRIAAFGWLFCCLPAHAVEVVETPKPAVCMVKETPVLCAYFIARLLKAIDQKAKQERGI